MHKYELASCLAALSISKSLGRCDFPESLLFLASFQPCQPLNTIPALCWNTEQKSQTHSLPPASLAAQPLLKIRTLTSQTPVCVCLHSLTAGQDRQTPCTSLQLGHAWQNMAGHLEAVLQHRMETEAECCCLTALPRAMC